MPTAHRVMPIRQGTGLFPRVVGFICSCGAQFGLDRLQDGYGAFRCINEEKGEHPHA